MALSFVAVPSHAEGGRLALDVSNVVLVGADLATTEAILARPGGYEMNPVLQMRGARLAVGATRMALSVGVPRYFDAQGHHGWAKAVRITALVVNGVVVAHNLRELRK